MVYYYWFQHVWHPEWFHISIMAKDPVSTLMYQLSSLGPHAGKQAIQFQCDILNLVLTINKDSTKDTVVMH